MITTLEPIIRAEDLFESLQPENESERNRRLKITRSPIFNEIIRGFERSLEIKVGVYPPWNDEDYHKIEEICPKGCKAEDIKQFSILLSDFEEREYFNKNSGLYLSALINKCQDRDISILTSHLNVSPSLVGCLNREKNIYVIGNIGYYLGLKMSGGKIHVSGNGRSQVGLVMKGGEIIITENVKNDLGEHMKGGKITVYGNTGESVGNQINGGEIIVHGNCARGIGDNMKRGKISVYGNVIDAGFGMRGGEIHLFGDYTRVFSKETDCGNVKNGNIYHRNKLIVENGRRVLQ